MNDARLNNGVMMPAIGFGVYQIPENETERAVSEAIEVGYRMFDTAASYFNEEQVGNAIRQNYHDYYKTSRGYHPRSLNSNAGWQTITSLPFLTFPLMAYAGEIKSAVLIVHGDKAYSLDASKEAYSRMRGDNKELLLIPGASHTDLYDRTDIIPFDKFEAFFRKYLR